MKNFPDLTSEQQAALDAFIAERGDDWKNDLRTAWCNASADPLLHQLRNSHGYAWLMRYGVKVGDGATICHYSDRHAATIVRMTATTITVQRDRAIRTDKNGMSDRQHWRYERDESAPKQVFRLHKDGHYYGPGGGPRLSLYDRSEFYDFTF